MNWILGTGIFLAVAIFEIFITRTSYVFFETETGTQQGSTNDNIFITEVLFIFAGSVFLFYIFPVLKARRNIK